jgi:hypothetical protein
MKQRLSVEHMLEKLARKMGNRSMRKKLGADLEAERPTSDARAIDAIALRLRAKARIRLRRGRTGPLE